MNKINLREKFHSSESTCNYKMWLIISVGLGVDDLCIVIWISVMIIPDNIETWHSNVQG